MQFRAESLSQFFWRGTLVFIISPDSIRDPALAVALVETYLNREPRLIETTEALVQITIPQLEARLEIAHAKTPATP